MNNSNLKLTLYHTDLCPFCQNFYPVWEKLKNNPIYKNKVEFNDIHKTEFLKRRNDDELEEYEKDIKTFPSIFLNNTLYRSDVRDEQTMCSLIDKTLTQNGGVVNYHKKYLKYKMKYKQLLRKNKIK